MITARIKVIYGGGMHSGSWTGKLLDPEVPPFYTISRRDISSLTDKEASIGCVGTKYS